MSPKKPDLEVSKLTLRKGCIGNHWVKWLIYIKHFKKLTIRRGAADTKFQVKTDKYKIFGPSKYGQGVGQLHT